ARLPQIDEIPQRVGHVNPDQGGLIRDDLAADQGVVILVAGGIQVGAQFEGTEVGVDLAHGGALDGFFVGDAVVDQVGDGADFEAVLFGEDLQVGTAGHGAVVIHDLDD